MTTHDELDQEVQAQYASKILSAGAVARLKEICLTTTPAPVSPMGRLSRFIRLDVRVVAAIVFVMTMVGLYSGAWWRDHGHDWRQMAAELAQHHHKQLPVEFPASDIFELRKSMTGLGFTPVRPQRFQGTELVGARYCGISGQTAAQMKFRMPAGHVITVFQLACSDTFVDLDSFETLVDGVRVQIWLESGLVIASVEPTP